MRCRVCNNYDNSYILILLTLSSSILFSSSNPKPNPNYSVWFSPYGIDKLQNFMDDYARNRGLPEFPAHVTLGSNYESLEEAFNVADYYRNHPPNIKLVDPAKPHLFSSSQDW
jgi:hypothetical protein